jgi:hypothetical protein
MSSEKGAVAVRPATTVTTVDNNLTVEQFVELLSKSPELSLDNAEEATKRIIEAILRAESDDELWAASEGSLLSLGEAVGEHLEIRGITLRESRVDGGLGYYYAVETVNLKTNVKKNYATGSNSIMAQLFNLQRRGKIPGIKIIPLRKVEATASGYHPMFLQPVRDHGDTDS